MTVIQLKKSQILSEIPTVFFAHEWGHSYSQDGGINDAIH